MTDARASSAVARVQKGRFGCGSDDMPANWDLAPDRRFPFTRRVALCHSGEVVRSVPGSFA